MSEQVAPEATAAPVAEPVETTPTSTENTPEVKASQPEPKKNIKKLKIKVDGEELEEALDLDDEESLKRHLQMSKAAQKRMQQAAEERKQMEQLLELMQKSPERVMKELGLDPEDFAVKLLEQKIEHAKKSPEQLEKERLQQELEELRANFQKQEEERKQAELTRLEKEIEKNLEDGIQRALDKNEIPKSRFAVRKMAEIMIAALQNDIDLSPEDVVPLMRREMEQDIKDLLASSPDDLVEALVGKDRLGKMRKKQVAAIKEVIQSTNQANVKATGNSVAKAQQPKNDKTKPSIHIRDFLKG